MPIFMNFTNNLTVTFFSILQRSGKVYTSPTKRRSWGWSGYMDQYSSKQINKIAEQLHISLSRSIPLSLQPPLSPLSPSLYPPLPLSLSLFRFHSLSQHLSSSTVAYNLTSSSIMQILCQSQRHQPRSNTTYISGLCYYSEANVSAQ